MDNKAKPFLLLALLLSTNPTVNSDCSVTEFVEANPCGGQLSCDRDFSDAISNIVQMPCLYIYNDYSEEHSLHQNFTISIKAKNFQFNANDSSVLNEIKDHVIAVAITNGKIKNFPDVILNLQQAETVDISSNQIESFNIAAFSRPSMLNVLNVSYNNIFTLKRFEPVGSPSYWLVPLKIIDLSHNNIKGVFENVIPPYTTLQHLNLSFNFIETFAENAFNNLTGLLSLDISNNRIIKLGSSLNDLVSVENLLLYHNNLTSLNEEDFNGLSALKNLNISSNYLKNVASSSFNSLVALTQLDLSNNQITKISKATFQKNSLLSSLDVSFNSISIIESGAFAGAHIADLKLHNNTLTGYLDTDAFNGLYFQKLDLSDADIGELGPDLFGPHPSFTSLNFSKNLITKISKTTFRNLNFLVDMDLSYNQLNSIDFDTTDLKNLTYLYMNNNAIKEIKRATFEPLDALNMVDLSNNAIEDIETQSFKNLKILRSLNLKHNPLKEIREHTFDGLSVCYSLDLSGTKIERLKNNSFNGMESLNNLNLSYSSTTFLEFNVFNGTGSIEFLDLTDNHLNVFVINQTNFKLQELRLGWNDIATITKVSFQGLRKVTFIDISHNSISYIQPGSFQDCESLNTLNLNNNNLSFLSFGVFEGLKTLRTIDLSNNRFHRFDGKLFYYVPQIDTVYLDNNFIDEINFTDFSVANIATLYIGGNLISCDTLMKFKYFFSPNRAHTMPLVVVAKSPIYDKENVNGVVCKGQTYLENRTEIALTGNVYLERIINQNTVTNRYLAANFGVLLTAALVALCIFVYYKFRSKLTLNLNVSSSREALSNAIELE